MAEVNSDPTLSRKPALALDLAILLLRYRRRLLAITVLAGFLAGVVVLVLPRKYTTTVSFTPAAADVTGGLSGLASQIGISLPTASSGQSPEFYATLLQAVEIQRPLVETPHFIHVGSDTETVNLIQYYGTNQSDSGKTIAKAIHVLNKKVLDVSYDNQTTIVTVTVTTTSRDLSYAVGQQLLSVVNAFNVTSRQTQGAEERAYLAGRLDTASTELHKAEGALETFVTQNRLYNNDPAKVFTYGRLQREVDLRQTLYVTLAQAYEQARIEAARNTPAITVVQHPAPALRSDQLHLIAFVVGAMLAAFVITLLWLIAEGALEVARDTRPAQYVELYQLWHDATAEARHPRRWLHRGAK